MRQGPLLLQTDRASYGSFPQLMRLGRTKLSARANKCTNFNANPTDLTGVTLSGDAAATLTVVDDTAALLAAGLQNICTSGKVYKLDNTGGTTGAVASVSGATGNTNPHTMSATLRTNGIAANIRYNDNTSVSSNYTATGYGRVTVPNASPADTIRSMRIFANQGAIVFFILNQLEEGAFVTSPIVVSGASASRTAYRW